MLATIKKTLHYATDVEGFKGACDCCHVNFKYHLALWRGVLVTRDSRLSLYRAEGMEEVELWHGQVYVMDIKHSSALLKAFGMHINTTMRS